jgi:DNA-dependent protein kinase catalytic subunit
VESLGGLTHPELRFKDGLKELQQRYVAAKDSKDCTKVVIEAYLALRHESVDLVWPAVQQKIGSYNRKKALEIKAIMDAAAGPNGEKLSKQATMLPSLQALVEGVGKVMAGMKFQSGKAPLSEFSSWLSDFDPTEHRIEVPGQYFTYSDRPPAVERHEWLSAVDPTLRVMSSIRKPKRIGLLGSGGGEFLFLVKGGEDLRNDERIELIFTLMNSIVERKMASDQTTVVPATAADGANKSNQQEGQGAQGLRARTYAVIPMTSKIGILEWVHNTVPLQAIISEEMALDADFCRLNHLPDASGTSNGATVDLSRLEAYTKRARWVGESNSAEDYHRMFAKADEQQASQVFRSLSESFPTDFLRRRLLAMSSNAETFLTLRSEFAKTLAISSLFGYILGLG